MNALLLLLAAVVQSGDGAAALADRASLPIERQPYAAYVTTAPADPEHREALDRALRLVVPSMAPKQVVLERCSPVPVNATLYRLDLLELRWPLEAWYLVQDAYPYNPAGGRPLVMRADWLLPFLTDAQESDAYYSLVFGRVPKTRDEALDLLGVDRSIVHRFGLSEGDSQVALQKKRFIQNLPMARGYAWGTEDFLRIDAKRDPLNSLLPGEGKPDGEEWIIGSPKVHRATGARGCLQQYLLANAKGEVVKRAPVDLVEDFTEFRGYREIRCGGSCISCHAGINYPTVNELRVALDKGVELKALYPTNESIEAFHLTDVAKEIRRNNEDYEAIVEKACGCSGVEAKAAFQSAVTRYDEDVDLETAAREYYLAPEECRLAIGWASANGYDMGPRLPLLAEGEKIPRAAFEESYRASRAAIDAWRVAAPALKGGN